VEVGVPAARTHWLPLTAVAALIALLLSYAGQDAASAQVQLTGAGATFPYPLIDTWRIEYQKIRPDINLNYQSIGSGGGIRQFTEKTVDFGATDAPLSASEREAAPGAVHIPETISSIVVSYNIPEVPGSGLNLSGPVVADIFLGEITRWNDPRIQEMNVDIQLPPREIVVVHRSDGSGTTFVWTDYLSKVSPEWHDRVGTGKAVQWPTGVGSPGNEGVSSSIKGTLYTIGYVELSYALTTNMTYAHMQNSAGNFVEPSFESISGAIAASAGLLPAGDESWEHVSTTDAPGENSYPISSFSYLLLYKEMSTNPTMTKEQARQVAEFVQWAVTDGQRFAPALGYIPLPDIVVQLNEETLRSLTYRGEPLLASEQDDPQTQVTMGAEIALAVAAAAGAAAVVYWRHRVGRALKDQAPGKNSREKVSAGLLFKRPGGDRVFRFIVIGAAGYSLLMLALVAFSVGEGSLLALSIEGLGFFYGTDWNPVEGRESYGALPYITGTLASAAIAMAIGVPISLGIAVFISEIAPAKIGTSIGFIVEILAAIPSIVYGLWALLVFRFWVLDFIEQPLYDSLGQSLAIFGQSPFGLDILTAGIVLAIMIIPIISSISREVLKAVPHTQREAAYSLGATRLEAVWHFVFPYAKAGILGAAILGLGRAVGETILVTMVIGNAVGINAIPTTLFSSSQTLSSIIANEFNEAASPFHVSALIGLGLTLFVLTMGINIAAQFLVSRMAKVAPGGRE
jgi:phosphate ABC transporter phosphate-binding protein/phosphate ABC transporter permease protein PstC